MPENNDSKNVLIAAHGNSLRSLVKFIEDLNDTDILKLEMVKLVGWWQLLFVNAWKLII